MNGPKKIVVANPDEAQAQLALDPHSGQMLDDARRRRLDTKG